MTATKRAFLFAHRWLGFITGLVVFIVSITGCIYCFQDDIQDLLYDYRKVQIQQKPLLKPSVFLKNAKARYPEAKVTLVVYYGPDRSVQVRMLRDKKAIAVFYNPYTGAYLHTEVTKDNFFAFIKKVHLYVFLPEDIGAAVNGICTLIFVVLMITGLILWLPNRKTDRKRAFSIKWKGKWKRINYDLHNVLGFYVTSIAIVLAITGLSFSYQWVNKGLYTMANLGKKYPNEKHKLTSDSTGKGKYPDSALILDKVYQHVKAKAPNNPYMLLYAPSGKGDKVMTATSYPTVLNFRSNDGFVFDQYTGKLLLHLPDSTKSAGMKLNNLNYDLHTGQVAGFFGKVIAFLASLISASLPITGLILYFGKKNKRKKRVNAKFRRSKYVLQRD